MAGDPDRCVDVAMLSGGWCPRNVVGKTLTPRQASRIAPEWRCCHLGRNAGPSRLLPLERCAVDVVHD